MKYLVLILSFCFFNGLFAQEDSRIIFKGHVSDSLTNQDIPFADVLIRDNDQKIVARTTSNVNGKFTMKLDSSGTFILEAYYTGYQAFKIKNYQIHNGVNYQEIRMSEPFKASLFREDFLSRLERRSPDSSGIITGLYDDGRSWGAGERLYLSDDHRFILELISSNSFGGSSIKQVHGTYDHSKQELQLLPEYVVNVYVSGHLSVEYDPVEIDTVLYGSSDTAFPDDTINLRYYIVKWQKYIYLLSDAYFSNRGYRTETNDIENFISYYNNGYEPQTHCFYLRKSLNAQKFNRELDMGQLPEKYHKMILDSPIEAKIVSVDLLQEGDENKFKIKINKGARDGVTEKMEFYAIKGGCSILINKVMESVSYGVADGSWPSCKKRKKLSTYLVSEFGEPE